MIVASPAPLSASSEGDSTLMLRNRERAGYDVTSERAETADDMREALARVSWGILISDYRMPTLDAPAALAVLQETGEDIPFLVVSGRGRNSRWKSLYSFRPIWVHHMGVVAREEEGKTDEGAAFPVALALIANFS